MVHSAFWLYIIPARLPLLFDFSFDPLDDFDETGWIDHNYGSYPNLEEPPPRRWLFSRCLSTKDWPGSRAVYTIQSLSSSMG
jgi:hypothetical protein